MAIISCLKKRIKNSLLYLLLLCVLAVSACDVYAGKRPGDFDQTTWICKEYRMAITVSKEIKPACTRVYIADLELGEISADFDYGRKMIFFEEPLLEYSPLMIFECSFSSKKMEATVTEDNLFDGTLKGKKLVFQRSTYVPEERFSPSMFE